VTSESARRIARRECVVEQALQKRRQTQNAADIDITAQTDAGTALRAEQSRVPRGLPENTSTNLSPDSATAAARSANASSADSPFAPARIARMSRRPIRVRPRRVREQAPDGREAEETEPRTFEQQPRLPSHVTVRDRRSNAQTEALTGGRAWMARESNYSTKAIKSLSNPHVL
jgi:hypothetical protein